MKSTPHISSTELRELFHLKKPNHPLNPFEFYKGLYTNFSISIASAIHSFGLTQKSRWTSEEYKQFLINIFTHEHKEGFLKAFSLDFIYSTINHGLNKDDNFVNNIIHFISLVEYRHRCDKKLLTESDAIITKIKTNSLPKIKEIVTHIFRNHISKQFLLTVIIDSEKNELHNSLEDFKKNNYRINKIYTIYGHDDNGFFRDGFDKNKKYFKNGTEYDDEGYDGKGYNKYGRKRDGFNRWGYDVDGYDRSGFDRWGYDIDGYDRSGFDTDGYNRKGFNRLGYNREGYNKEGFDNFGFNKEGIDKEGFNTKGFHVITKQHANGTLYNGKGFDYYGYNQDGYNKEGYNKDGYNVLGFDKNGLDRGGFDINGYNVQGFNREGYNQTGYNSQGEYNKKYDMRTENLTSNNLLNQSASQQNITTIRLKDEAPTETSVSIPNLSHMSNIPNNNFSHLSTYKEDNRINRGTYFKIQIPLTIGVGVCNYLLNAREIPPEVWAIFAGIIVIVSFVISIKRLHDFNQTGWLALFRIIPFTWLIIGLISGTDGPNKYGPRPQ